MFEPHHHQHRRSNKYLIDYKTVKFSSPRVPLSLSFKFFVDYVFGCINLWELFVKLWWLIFKRNSQIFNTLSPSISEIQIFFVDNFFGYVNLCEFLVKFWCFIFKRNSWIERVLHLHDTCFLCWQCFWIPQPLFIALITQLLY